MRIINVDALHFAAKGDAVDWLTVNPDATLADVLALACVEIASKTASVRVAEQPQRDTAGNAATIQRLAALSRIDAPVGTMSPELIARIESHKSELLATLQFPANDSSMMVGQETANRGWVGHVEEINPDIITVPVTCATCGHYQRTTHPYLGHCVAGEPEDPVDLWDTDQRTCESWSLR